MRPTANWAGNVTFTAARYAEPSTVDELRRLVAGARRVRALGTGHSFSPIADCRDGDLVSVAGLPSKVDIDGEAGTVTVAAGMRYAEFVGHLHDAGLALHSMGSLPHLSVAGAVATATHGSGDRNRNLSAAVSGLELVTASGDLVTVTRMGDPERFPGMVASLGALGVVTSVTLNVEPAYDVRQYVYEGLPEPLFFERFDEVFASGYSVSAFTTWRGTAIDQVWCKQRVGAPMPPEGWLGTTMAPAQRHPVPGQSGETCTEQRGVPGPWYARLPHFRPEHRPSTALELQSEYLLPREHALDALRAVGAIRDRVGPVVKICEIRTVAADDLWMSTAYGRDTVGVHFTWIADATRVAPAIAAVEDQLGPFQARPHWAKLFGVPAATVRALYPRYADFVRLVTEYDPGGKFRNDLLDEYL
jgi:xylitol oxidase